VLNLKIYQRVLAEDKDGVEILEELAAEFVYNEQFVPGDPHATAFKLGCKHVVMELMRRAANEEPN